MLARLQKILTLSLLGAAAGIAAWLAHGGHALRGAAIALLVVFGYALVLGVEFVLLHWVSRADPGPRATAGQLLRAWWGEVRAMPQVFFWRQPFRSHAEPDHVPSPARGERGLVLVHGFVCNRGFWNPWLHELRAAGVPFVAVDLEPVFGSIDAYAPLIEDAVARLEATTGAPVVLVGHSMGGLAIRAWLRKFKADARVHRVVTIGSPHGGTWLARLALARNAMQMRLASPWLADLAASEPRQRRSNFTCFYGDCDNIVFPASSGTLPDADNRHVPGAAHLDLASQAAVFDEVLHLLREAPRRACGATA